MISRPFILVLALLVSLPLVACDIRPGRESVATPQRAYEGQARPYELGFSSLPTEFSETAYRQAFQTAGQFGEVILVQRPPLWSEFREGGTISAETTRTTEAEKELAAALHLDFFVAIDIIDPAKRDRIALPAEWQGASILDPEVKEAYLAYAEYMALNYRPAYMALAVEANMLYEQNRGEFEDFLPVYRDAYRRVKAVSPETRVFVTFQYEELLGLVPWRKEHEARWEIAELFEPDLDLFAISTYPSFVYARADAVPPDYYLQIQDYTALPIALAESGYASGPGPGGLNSGTEGDQARYVRQLLDDAEFLRAALVIWFASADPALGDGPPYDLFRSIGLRRRDGSAKLAWQSWQEAAHRPPAGAP